MVGENSFDFIECLKYLLICANFPTGIFDTIFDGIQRPLKTIADVSNSVFIPRGIEVPKLD